ncbi:MAG TPA: hypothetical protein VLR10_01610, partial [Nitrososphaeraceae archaeon]|nr:hypothetical protein [Nitrososphaeraceae archaeon]
MSEDDKIDRFLRRLKDKTQIEVEMKEPQSLTECMRIAKRYDMILFQANRRTQDYYQRPYQTPRQNVNNGPTPMDLDIINTQKKPLTQDERDKLCKAGHCFYFRKQGH